MRKWFKKKDYIPIPGYRISDTVRQRRRALLKEVMIRGDDHDAIISVLRSLQAIINVNPSKHSDAIMKRDIIWMRHRWNL